MQESRYWLGWRYFGMALVACLELDLSAVGVDQVCIAPG